ncbi:MAG TPA: four helix bundle protein [Polyangiaceae bacterium]
MKNSPSLPHHRLHVFGLAREMLVAVRDAHIRDAKLRDEALRAAKGTCLNCAEGAGRVTRADKARAFTVARGEAVEAAAAVEIAALLGDARAEDAERVAVLADRVVAMLTLPTQPTSVLGRLRISRDLLRVPWAETLGRRARSKRGR